METLIKVDENLGFDADDFVALWNSESAKNQHPTALKKPPQPSMFAPDIMLWLGRAADIIAIAGFIGVPTISDLISRLRATRPAAEEEIEIDVREGTHRTYVRIKRRGGRVP